MLPLSFTINEFIDLIDAVNDQIQNIEDKIEIAGARGNEHLREQCDNLRLLVAKLERAMKET